MNEISKEELKNAQIDPVASVSLVLNKIEDGSDAMMVDPSNPYMLMLETIAMNAAVLRDEMNTKHTRRYAKLANTESDLYNNMSYIEFKKVFANPADSMFRITINVTEFDAHAKPDVNDKFVMVSIPENSMLNVDGHNFLIASRIDIKRYKNETFSIEQNVGSNKIGQTSLGILPHVIYTGDENTTLLAFDTLLKQLTLTRKKQTINPLENTNITLPIEDKIHYIEARLRNNSGFSKVYVTYSEILDPEKPSIIVKRLTKEIEITVPDLYLIDGTMVGELHLDIYTTKGKIDFPLHTVPSEEIAIEYTDTSTDIFTSVIGGLKIAYTPLERLTGGSNGLTFEQLRNSIVNNSIGSEKIPLSDSMLLKKISDDGFYGYLLKDIVATRLYIASRTIPLDVKQLEHSKPDLLMFKTNLTPNELTNHSTIKSSTDAYDKLIIRKDTFFKEDNGRIIPIDDIEKTKLLNLGVIDRIDYLNNNNIYYTPFSYISSIKNNIYELRIVDYNPKITFNRIIYINNIKLERVNIKSYSIKLVEEGFKVRFEMITNNQFDSLDPNIVYAQLRIPIDGKNYIYMQTKLDKPTNSFEFLVTTDFYVDTEAKLNITSGVSEIATRHIELLSECELATYIKEASVAINPNNYINDQVYTNTDVTVLTKEKVRVLYGTLVDRLYGNIVISYTDKKYKTYDKDIIAKYDKDVYDASAVGNILEYTKGKVTYKKLHNKGDDILGKDGKPIIKFKKGDVIRDDDGKPVVDRINGIVKLIDILMLEYNHKYAVGTDKDTMSVLNSYLSDIKEYDDFLLEQTDLRFKPFRDNRTVKINYNDTFKAFYKKLKPEVTLYIESKIDGINEDKLINIKNQIGTIIQDELNKDIFYVADMKERIKDTIALPTVAIGIKLDAKDDYLKDVEKVTLYDKTNRLHLNKYLINTLGGVRVSYDIEVIIRKP